MDTQCCVVGGGPAGLMLGFLLARAGVQTVVLEKHGDFLRDFRGDTVHPSTLRIMDELGLLEAFAASYLSLLTGGAFGAEYKDIFAFSILILILIFRPKGLLGEVVRERA